MAGALAALALIVGATLFLPHSGEVKALVVRAPICAGCEIKARDLRERQVQRSALPQHYYLQATEVTGKKAAVALEPGTVMQPSLLLENSLADLAPGEVAFALSVEDPAVAGFSQTGQIVEIWSSNPNTENQLLATGVRVLGMEAAKDSLLGATSSKAIVYLGASEEAARKVVAAKSSQDLAFVLRG